MTASRAMRRSVVDTAHVQGWKRVLREAPVAPLQQPRTCIGYRAAGDVCSVGITSNIRCGIAAPRGCGTMGAYKQTK